MSQKQRARRSFQPLSGKPLLVRLFQAKTPCEILAILRIDPPRKIGLYFGLSMEEFTTLNKKALKALGFDSNQASKVNQVLLILNGRYFDKIESKSAKQLEKDSIGRRAKTCKPMEKVLMPRENLTSIKKSTFKSRPTASVPTNPKPKQFKGGESSLRYPNENRIPLQAIKPNRRCSNL